jgi:hypothetical protein
VVERWKVSGLPPRGRRVKVHRRSGEYFRFVDGKAWAGGRRDEGLGLGEGRPPVMMAGLKAAQPSGLKD